MSLKRAGRDGEDYFKGRPTKDIRTVAILYPLRNTIFVKKDSKYKTLADLKGARGPTRLHQPEDAHRRDQCGAGARRHFAEDMQGVLVANIVANANAFKEGRTDFFVFALGGAPVREADATVGGVRALAVREDAGDRRRGQEGSAGRLSAL